MYDFNYLCRGDFFKMIQQLQAGPVVRQRIEQNIQ